MERTETGKGVARKKKNKRLRDEKVLPLILFCARAVCILIKR